MRKGQVAVIYIVFFIAALFSQQVLALNEVKLHQDIEWVKVKGFSLTTDIYSPQKAVKPLPVLVIFHGGGWLVNNKSIMKDMALYMASHADLVVVNMNYRLLGDNNNSTTINEIVEDALGAVLWVKDHIQNYGGDPAKIAVTGDSAGGHLASMVMLAGRALDSKGFTPQSQKFTPSYLPKGKTAEQIAAADGARVQAVILSYTAFDLLQSAKVALRQHKTRSGHGVTPARVACLVMVLVLIAMNSITKLYRLFICCRRLVTNYRLSLCWSAARMISPRLKSRVVMSVCLKRQDNRWSSKFTKAKAMVFSTAAVTTTPKAALKT